MSDVSVDAGHLELLRKQHSELAEAAHARDDIPEANYQYGWVDAIAAVLNKSEEGL